MAQLSIYNGSVTSGGTNGTLITTGDILKYTGEKGELGNVVPYALRAALTTNVYNVSLSIIGSNPEGREHVGSKVRIRKYRRYKHIILCTFEYSGRCRIRTNRIK
jgi:hypothetical protein